MFVSKAVLSVCVPLLFFSLFSCIVSLLPFTVNKDEYIAPAGQALGEIASA